MKKLIFSLLALFIAVTASAVPAKRGYVTIPQSDGTSITVDMIGDEFHHSFITLDGRTIDRDEKGDFYYRTASGISAVKAHDPAKRDASEQAFVEANKELLSLNAIITAEQKARRTRANVQRRATQVPNNGSPRVPIILVNYTDIKFKNSDPVAQFNEQFNVKDISCYNYFVDQSKGLFTPQFDIIGLVNLTHNRAYYGGNQWGNDKGVGKMVAEAILALKDSVDFTPYDNDHDNELDVVIVLYAGVGEAQAYQIVPNAVWPCQWQLDESDYGSKVYVTDNVYANKFAVFNELYGYSDNNTRIDGIGTFCHEFSHCLGLPDFYDTAYGGHYGMGNWSLLDSGCYADDGDTPVGYDAYERAFMGWFTPIKPEENNTYILDPLHTDTGEAYILVSDYNSNEYVLIENRQKTGWDAYLPASGMLITHVDYLQSAWDGNTVNNYSTQRMTIYPADNNLNSETEFGDTYPYNGNNSFTDSSTPAAKLHTGGYLSKPITDITKLDNNRISFGYMLHPFEKVVPEFTDTIDIQADGFTAHWTAVDSVKSYTLKVMNLEVKPTYELVLSEGFSKFKSDGTTDISSSLNSYMENKGWTGSHLYTAKKGIRIGRAASNGSLTSPNIDIASNDAKMTVIFNAHTYNNDTNCGLIIDNGYDQKEVTIPNNTEGYYAVVLETDSALSQQITFTTKARAKRVILSSIDIYSGDASMVEGAPRREPAEVGDEMQRTITGITDTLYTVAGLASGTYEINVKATYVDDTESKWSPKWTITLEGGTPPALQGDVNGDGKVDVEDINILVNIILGNDEPENYDGRANVDGTGSVDVNDINVLLNIMLAIE